MTVRGRLERESSIRPVGITSLDRGTIKRLYVDHRQLLNTDQVKTIARITPIVEAPFAAPGRFSIAAVRIMNASSSAFALRLMPSAG
jgi:hypothetical protein